MAARRTGHGRQRAGSGCDRPAGLGRAGLGRAGGGRRGPAPPFRLPSLPALTPPKPAPEAGVRDPFILSKVPKPRQVPLPRRRPVSCPARRLLPQSLKGISIQEETRAGSQVGEARPTRRKELPLS